MKIHVAIGMLREPVTPVPDQTFDLAAGTTSIGLETDSGTAAGENSGLVVDWGVICSSGSALSSRQASAKRVAASTVVAAAKAFPAAQAGRSAAKRAVSMGKPSRSGLWSRWHRQPSPPPPSDDGDTARRKETQQASVGAGGEPASGGVTAATCGRQGEMDTIVAAHCVVASRTEEET